MTQAPIIAKFSEELKTNHQLELPFSPELPEIAKLLQMITIGYNAYFPDL